MSLNRRKFLQFGMGSAGALILGSPISKAIAGACGLTPPQTSGPFFPGESKFTLENDLTKVVGASQAALGQVILITGRVVDQNCNPVPNANVEIWQACASGRYNHPNDPNPAPMDPNFKYWGENVTNANGEYSFKTIIPGPYQADTDWMRPPHIHYKISALGYKELITQLYFKSEAALNNKDLILLNVPAAERDSVIVDFQSMPGSDVLTGKFDITLVKLRR